MSKAHLLFLCITLLATGANLLFSLTDSGRCQKMVLRDLKANAAYAEELRSTVGSQDFLTEMTRGK